MNVYYILSKSTDRILKYMKNTKLTNGIQVLVNPKKTTIQTLSDKGWFCIAILADSKKHFFNQLNNL